MDAITILSTKKLKPSICREAAEKGMRILNEDFITIHYIDDESVKNSFEGLDEYLVFTSQHAVKGFQMNSEQASFPLPPKKIFCLDGETLKAVHAIQNAEVISAYPHADALANDISLHPEVKSISFICGNRRLDHLPNLLHKSNIQVNEVMVYRTAYNGKRIHDPYQAVLFFSPSGVESFFQTNILSRNIPCFCIGGTTATSVSEHTRNEVIVAGQSTQDSMLEAVQHYFSKKKKDKQV